MDECNETIHVNVNDYDGGARNESTSSSGHVNITYFFSFLLFIPDMVSIIHNYRFQGEREKGDEK